MPRYIDADKLIDDLEHDIAIDQDHILYVGIDMREKELIQFDKDCKQNCIDMLSKAPAADVRENVRGEWVTPTEKVYSIDGEDITSAYKECNRCHKVYVRTNDNFCPNCGADMRGDKT